MKNISIIIITYNTSEKNSETLFITNKYKVPFKKFIWNNFIIQKFI